MSKIYLTLLLTFILNWTATAQACLPVPIVTPLESSIDNNNFITVNASDFNVASYSPCGTPANQLQYSFTADVNDNSRTYNCDNVGFVDLDIFVTDPNGEQNVVFTYLSISAPQSSCQDDNTNDCRLVSLYKSGLNVGLGQNGEASVNINNYILKPTNDCNQFFFASYSFSEGSTVTDYTATCNPLGYTPISIYGSDGPTTQLGTNNFIVVQDNSMTCSSSDDCLPIPIAVQQLIVGIDENGMATIEVDKFNSGSYSNCGGSISLSFEENAVVTQKNLTCEDVGFVPLELWVTDLNTGAKNKVNTGAALLDLIGYCTPDEENITGTIETAIYKACVSITSDGTVAENGSVEFNAGNSIQLNANFSVPAGSLFLATVDPNTCPAVSPTLEELKAKRPQLQYPIATTIQAETATQSTTSPIHIYPNPTQNSTVVDFYLAETQSVDLQVYDWTGSEVLSVFKQNNLVAGQHQSEIDLSQMSNGIYYLTIRYGERTEVKRIVVQR